MTQNNTSSTGMVYHRARKSAGASRGELLSSLLKNGASTLIKHQDLEKKERTDFHSCY